MRTKIAGSCRYVVLISLVVLSAGNTAFSQSISQVDSSITHSVDSISPKWVTARSFILPAALITTGAFGISGEFIISDPEIKEERDEHFAHFHTRIDNYLQYAPVAAGYGYLLAHYNKHLFWDYTKKILVTEVIVNGLVQPVKHITKVERPDGSARNSFPSGHTAQAFAGATIFCDEFAQHNTWLIISAYTSAMAVGALRIMNNRHWASDVIAGAGFGILSAKLSEWIIEPHSKKRISAYHYQF